MKWSSGSWTCRVLQGSASCYTRDQGREMKKLISGFPRLFGMHGWVERGESVWVEEMQRGWWGGDLFNEGFLTPGTHICLTTGERKKSRNKRSRRRDEEEKK